MSDNKRKVVLKVDAEHYSLIKEYGQYTNKSEKYVLSQLVNYSLSEYAKKYKELKKGYRKMGEINLEISQAFCGLENETFGQIEDELHE